MSLAAVDRTIGALAVPARSRTLSINTDHGQVSAIHVAPRRPAALFALAHGAGAGMRHPFLESIAAALAERDVATLRYQFAYMEAGRKAPDRAPKLEAVVRAAVGRAAEIAAATHRDLPLIAGGKSMGSRMTTRAHAEAPLPGVRGIVALGYPLHRPGGAGDLSRADHLDAVDVPMLLVQGTRDHLADLDAVQRVAGRLGERVTVHVVAGGDHSFGVLKRSGRDPAEVIDEIAIAVAGWIAACL